MLQPRILLRQSLRQCQCLHTTLVNRSYATATKSLPPKAVVPQGMIQVGSTASGSEPKVPLPSRYIRAGIRSYKPRTPGVRHLKRPVNDHLWKGRPFLPLTHARKGQHIGGRNNQGRVSVRHRGGGAKRRIRTVDFVRMAPGRHMVDRIEFDPGRSAHIALVTNVEERQPGEKKVQRKSYILAAEGMREGDVVQSYRKGIPDDLLKSMGGVMDPGMIAAKTAWRGNCLPVHLIPVGSSVFNIGLTSHGRGQLCRSAGTHAIIVGKDENDSRGKNSKYVHLKLSSGEVRKIPRDACATIGVASNSQYQRRQLGKAGRSRWLGIRPTVRGVAMNAFEHAHGGGRGKSKGNVNPVSPWGTLAKGGFKTRRRSKSNSMVVVPRVRNQGKRRTGGAAK
ncbi:MAG: 50S ribosomal L2 [Lasallia pustulata]|uniref:Large ribosomal subunit protein uL2m n=1 Tax=Lasallia pustulata TaxID=136370 RepID=A0A5M8PCL1_9LECA|nr:MAG: 50S ribosomal L2 [Lasallia pustulata]